MTSGFSSECIFLPNKPERNGYVRLGRKHVLAHRKAFEEMYGPLPPGYTVDHDCHNQDMDCPGGPCKHRACINGEHLLARTCGDNLHASRHTWASINSAKEVCSNGHAFTEANTYLGPTKGDRQCRMCKLLDHQHRFAAKMAREWGLKDIGILK